jgi:predicted NACHT family NTPase
MAQRSLKASPNGIAKAEVALTDREWSQKDLAKKVEIQGQVEAGITAQTVKKFFNGKAVDRKYFVGICKALGLSWDEITESLQIAKSISQTSKYKFDSKVDVTVQQESSKQIWLQLSEEGKQIANHAFISYFDTIGELTDQTELSHTTVYRFLEGKRVQCKTFLKVCNALQLNWREVAELDEDEDNNSSEVDAIVRKMRRQIASYLKKKCGIMKILKMSQPIGLGNIYTNVNILEKITGRREINIAELTQDIDPENFDRFCLGDVQEKSISGLEAVDRFSMLMILGKPGAGKTTFLRYLAMQCINQKFRVEQVPIFVTLKDFAETEGHPTLFEYILRQFSKNPRKSEENELEKAIEQGRIFLLLDGLDEVRKIDNNRVLTQIRDFAQRFSENQFIITYRIAAKEYIFEQFTEVEIADFNDVQIADFSGKWFHHRNDPIKAKRFVEKIQSDESIRELATNPLLLTLLCLVFEDSGDFPNSRAELYQIGIDALLKNWDITRNIYRDNVSRELSLKRKQDLLSKIALTTFRSGKYFFKKRELEYHISDYIKNLPNQKTSLENLEIDSEEILSSIKAHHGLFIERASGIYSFSHLTFQEYFTARKIVCDCNPSSKNDLVLQELIDHLFEKNWREVFLLTTELLDNADIFLKKIKEKIDFVLEQYQCLKNIIMLVNNQIKIFQKYLLPRNKNNIKGYSFSYIAFNSSMSSQITSHRSIPSPILTHDEIKQRIRWIIQSVTQGWRVFYYYIPTSLLSPRNIVDKPLNHINHKLNIESYLEEPQKYFDEQNKFRKALLLELQENPKKFEIKYSIKNLKEYNFENSSQYLKYPYEKILDQYYYANLLLMDCLNSDCYVSRAVRQEIEETIFLPSAEPEI